MLAHKTWGSGIIFDTNKVGLLTTGGNQTWYSFKMSLREHHLCSSLCSGSQVHLKAKQHYLKSLQHEGKRLDIITNDVASALEVCKIKSAALLFEPVLGLVSFCGGEIGNIGHGM